MVNGYAFRIITPLERDSPIHHTGTRCAQGTFISTQNSNEKEILLKVALNTINSPRIITIKLKKKTTKNNIYRCFISHIHRFSFNLLKSHPFLVVVGIIDSCTCMYYSEFVFDI
jgi:hypothetical protein